MENNYFNKKIDGLGRLVIPKEIREQLNIYNGNILNISINDEAVVIRKNVEKTDTISQYIQLANSLTDMNSLDELDKKINKIIKSYK